MVPTPVAGKDDSAGAEVPGPESNNRKTKEFIMSDQKQKMVIVASRGLDDERATASMTIANGGLAAGFDVTMFLIASGVDLVRKGGVEHARMNPFDPPLKELVEDFQAKGGSFIACPPCAKVRGYRPEDLLDGVEIAGSAALHALIKQGAVTLSF
jgi:predicted peroxiredoxin